MLLPHFPSGGYLAGTLLKPATYSPPIRTIYLLFLLLYLRIGLRSVPERGFGTNTEQFQLLEAGHVPGHFVGTLVDRHNSGHVESAPYVSRFLGHFGTKCPAFLAVLTAKCPAHFVGRSPK